MARQSRRQSVKIQSALYKVVYEKSSSGLKRSVVNVYQTKLLVLTRTKAQRSIASKYIVVALPSLNSGT